MREWKLLYEKTMEEDSTEITIENDMDGNPFEVTELLIIVQQKAFSERGRYIKIVANDAGFVVYGNDVIGTVDRYAKLHALVVCGKIMDVGSFAGNNQYSMSGFSSYGYIEGVNIQSNSITKIKLTSNITSEKVYTAGSKYIVYGR